MPGGWMRRNRTSIPICAIEKRKDLMFPNALGSATKYFNAYPLANAKRSMKDSAQLIQINEFSFLHDQLMVACNIMELLYGAGILVQDGLI